MAFQVSSKIDSRTILDQQGAESLLGMGDMLYLPPGSGLPVRVHGAFVSDEEVHRVVDKLKEQGEPNYIEGILEGGVTGEGDEGAAGGTGSTDGESDPLYDQAVDVVLKKAVHPDPHQRYDELSEFVFDLRHPNKTLLGTPSAPLIERNPLLFWQALCLILLLAVLLLLLVQFGGRH